MMTSADGCRPADAVADILARVRRERPLVHNITNWVVTSITANATLAIGASPVMAHAHEEAAEFARIARALVLNIGTLTPYTIESMRLAGVAANAAGVPVVLDPVGYGATGLRTKATEDLLDQVKVSIIRGNGAEMAGIAGRAAAIRGVDSVGAAPEAGTAVAVAKQRGLVAAVTGPVDFVSDGKRLLRIDNGHHLLTMVTGTGCTASALVGAFAAVEPDGLMAAGAALAAFAVAGEVAAERADGPGTFAAHLLDALYHLDEQTIRERARLELVTA
jgi:hydroxyethylthiazole kinase